MAINVSSQLIVDLQTLSGSASASPRHAVNHGGSIFLSASFSGGTQLRLIRIDSDDTVELIETNLPSNRTIIGLGSAFGRLLTFIVGTTSDAGFYSSIDGGSTWVRSPNSPQASVGFVNFSTGPARCIAVSNSSTPAFQTFDGVNWAPLSLGATLSGNFEGSLNYFAGLGQFAIQGPSSSGTYRKSVVAQAGGDFPTFNIEGFFSDTISDDNFNFPASSIFYDGFYYNGLTSSNVRRTLGYQRELTGVANIARSDFVTPGAAQNTNYVIWSFGVVNNILLGKSPARVDYYDPDLNEFIEVPGLPSYAGGTNTVRNPTAILDGGYYATFGSQVFRIDASVSVPEPPPPELPDPIEVDFPVRNYAQYRGQPKLESWLNIVPNLGEQIFQKADEVRRSYDIDSVGGEALNVVGRIVVLPRSVATTIEADYTEFGNSADEFGADRSEFEPPFIDTPVDFLDPLFRILIRAKIHKNNSLATFDSIIQSANIIAPGNTCTVIDNGNRSLSLSFSNALTEIQALVFTSFGSRILPIAHGIRFAGFTDTNILVNALTINQETILFNGEQVIL